ncbi:protein kinase domain-containing protein [Chondromyces crocatus]|uniref:Serine/threonine protein kinase n=1 Tax=Chondromyces crocatus TaxID=52 RepID=A0A0K1EJQ1_CHOCO|nr:protein kinase [Chondromyces crocatus]AKT41074.1 serine/threonine protein kinase [Chondromyces crocatus]
MLEEPNANLPMPLLSSLLGSDSLEPPSGWCPPKVFEEYRLLRLLGWGGMGEVYLAQDALLERLVAVKFLSAIDPDHDGRDLLLQEARAAARLQHPNVVSIYRVGEIDARPFIISEFVRGTSLDLLDHPLPWTRVLELGIGLARGLGAAHRRGVLHRDIKPGNAILTEDGEVKLLDFGLAKLVEHGAARSTPNPATLAVAAAVAQLDSDPAPPLPPEDALALGHVAEATDITFRCVVPLSPTTSAISGERAVTSVTALQGTPLYMAPELWIGEAASPRTDVYALGLVLYELCAGELPHASLPMNELPRAARSQDIPPLATVVHGVDRRLASVVDRCLRRDPAERYASGDELREALEQLITATRNTAMPEGNPYRGLLPFDAEHRALFFGRTAEIGAVLDRLRAEPAVMIAGDSGVGKSSLCSAGVIPLVLDGALGDGRTWTTLRVPRSKRRFAAALARILGEEEERSLARLADPIALARDVHRRLGPGQGLLLYLDQVEELLTLTSPEEAQTLGEALGQLASRAPCVRLLMTVRSDFLTRAATIPGLGDVLARGLYLLRPLAADRISEAIVGPARAKGVAFESTALIDKLAASTSSAEGLPLLQFALAELWDARAHPDAPITEAALDAIGGVAGALARHGDGVLLGLPEDQRSTARRLLLALVTLEGTRAKRSEAELFAGDPSAREALEALVRGRLLVMQQSDEGTTIEIAHEALLRGWGTLRRWLDEQQGSRPVRHRLEAAAAEWERLGGTRDALWGGRQLEEATLLDEGDLGPRARDFLQSSRHAVRGQRRARTGALLGIPLAALLAYGGIQLAHRREVTAHVTTHRREAASLAQQALEKEAALGPLRTSAFADFDGSREEDAERRWAEVLTLAATAEHLRVRAGLALEAALSVDGDNTVVRSELADLLYQRALAAERDGAHARRDELLDRLAVYDSAGERALKWHAPASLSLETTPPGAHITLARYSTQEHRARRLGEARELGHTPLPAMDLPAGSYLLTVEAEGRAPIRYPVLLGRDERLSLNLFLPPATAIPSGFIYVPPGRYLSGSAADDTLRQSFFSASPLHPVTTDAYSIARHETTFQEWIEFLESLPPGERALRTPKVGAAGLAGALELLRLPDGTWQLSIQPTTQPLTARAGEPITYTKRSRHAGQDWRHFPVSGISRHDAHAYTAWLRATGRVPGARLCTEQEWERAARGADDREFPAGDVLEPHDANIDSTHGSDIAARGPDQVGLHAGSRSPFEADDMAGNVFEWTTSATPGGPSFIRGGAYYYEALTARIANRTRFAEDLRDPRLGLRVCAAPPAESAPRDALPARDAGK